MKGFRRGRNGFRRASPVLAKSIGFENQAAGMVFQRNVRPGLMDGLQVFPVRPL
jgi:hypothetical protein